MMQALEIITFALAITTIIYFIIEYILKKGFKFDYTRAEIVHDLLTSENFNKSKMHYDKKKQTFYFLLGEYGVLKLDLSTDHQIGLGLGLEENNNNKKQQAKDKKRLNELSETFKQAITEDRGHEYILAVICAELVQWDKECAGITRHLPF